jgi:hypothetical protein
MLSERIGWELPLRELPTARLQLVELVRTCTQTPYGVTALADVMEELEPGSPTTLTVRRLAGEWESKS